MKRREALQKAGFLFGGIMGASTLLQLGFTFRSEEVQGFFSQDQINLLNEVGETILPKTETPGAKEAKVGEFMTVIVRDCYEPKDQKIFIDGMDKLNASCKQKYGKSFMECNSIQRTELLNSLDKVKTDYFQMMKGLTLSGYYTSELGATQFLKYTPVPGRYDGCTSIRPW